jgi:hypothetical protein
MTHEPFAGRQDRAQHDAAHNREIATEIASVVRPDLALTATAGE